MSVNQGLGGIECEDRCSKAALVNGYTQLTGPCRLAGYAGPVRILMETCSKAPPGGLRSRPRIETFIPVTIEQDGVAVCRNGRGFPQRGSTMMRHTIPVKLPDFRARLLTGAMRLLRSATATVSDDEPFRLAHRTIISRRLDSTVSAVIPVKAMSEVEKNLAADGDRMASLAITDRCAMVQWVHLHNQAAEGQFLLRQVFRRISRPG